MQSSTSILLLGLARLMTADNVTLTKAHKNGHPSPRLKHVIMGVDNLLISFRVCHQLELKRECKGSLCLQYG